MKFLSVIVLVALLPGLALARMPEATEQTELGSGTGIDLTLTLPLYEVIQDEAGFDVIQVEGFNLSGEPGEALLPRRVYNVAVPPDAAFDSLSVQIVSGDVAKLPGTYNLKLAVPDMPSTGFVDDSVPCLPHSVSSSGLTPSDFVRLLPPGQMRKWRFARLEFSPFYYDTGSGELTVTRQLTAHIGYTTDRSLSAQDTTLLGDSVMDDAASELLVNFDTAQGWYRSMGTQDAPGAVYDYVIITTNAIESNSTKLADFVIHKQSRGHGVLIITETEYGSLAGEAPNGTAEKIRKWLQDNYVSSSIEYVLLIGDPDPDDPNSGSDSVGDVPMKMCWPNRNSPIPDYALYPESPTDAFYADLTGNWDLDGDGYFGEWDDYQGTGGVDFANEVYVGRIPVYSADYSTLDAILQKTMDYENEPAPASWREIALLPMSFSDSLTDGAYLAKQMMDDFLNDSEYSSWTMYQHMADPCGVLNSKLGSDEELSGDDAVRERWRDNDYGLVVWWAHGSQTSAQIGYWPCTDGTLFSSTDASLYLDDDHPSFVYQNSCSNGYPENSNNLQYALLKQGAIGAVGATRVSWYSRGQTQFADSTTNAGIGYEYAKRLVQNNLPAGEALCSTKASMTPTSSPRLMNYYDFNLYGDPSIGLTSTAYGHAISGYVRDSELTTGIGGVTVEFGGARPAVTTSGEGYYSQAGFVDGTYTVAVRLDGYTFSPFEDQVTVSDADTTHDVTGYLESSNDQNFSDGFESGSLGSNWSVETDYEGRVRVDSTYPYSGTYSLLLDDDTDNSTFSHAAVILPLDLWCCTQADLSFWWRGFDDDNHPDDGVFISDDGGGTWQQVYSFNNSPSTYTRETRDLVEEAAAAGLTLNSQFQVKFQFYDNDPIDAETDPDGYAIDEISIDVTIDPQEVFLPIVMR